MSFTLLILLAYAAGYIHCARRVTSTQLKFIKIYHPLNGETEEYDNWIDQAVIPFKRVSHA